MCFMFSRRLKNKKKEQINICKFPWLSLLDIFGRLKGEKTNFQNKGQRIHPLHLLIVVIGIVYDI